MAVNFFFFFFEFGERGWEWSFLLQLSSPAQKAFWYYQLCVWFYIKINETYIFYIKSPLFLLLSNECLCSTILLWIIFWNPLLLYLSIQSRVNQHMPTRWRYTYWRHYTKKSSLNWWPEFSLPWSRGSNKFLHSHHSSPVTRWEQIG